MEIVRFTERNDTLVLGSNATFLGLGGDDIYVFEPSAIPANAEIVISDNDGSNTLRFPDGLDIVGSQIATLGNGSNALRLTLSDGTTVLIDGAGDFTFEVGGNFGGFGAVTQDFETFVTDTLGASVPAPGGQSTGGAVTIGGAALAAAVAEPGDPAQDESLMAFALAAAADAGPAEGGEPDALDLVEVAETDSATGFVWDAADLALL